MRSGLGLFLLGLASLALSKQNRGKGGDDDDKNGDSDSDNIASTTTSSAASSATSSAASSNSTSTLTGDSVCLSYMCVSAVVNGSEVQYTMQSLGQADLGWMAIGFGDQMANTPMVIMWSNSDGSVTLSQRMASGEVMPTVVSNPSRTATADEAASDLTGSEPKLAFTISSDGSTSQSLIWAFGTTNPDSASESATLIQHIDSGTTSLNLAKTISSNSTSDPASDPDASQGSTTSPLLPFQKMIVAHAILCTLGFLILLPAGALVARYMRTFYGGWFQGHWIFQFGLAAPIIIAGVALGIAAVATAKAPQLDDDHKRWGIVIFVLYFLQCTLGAIIHWVKPSSWTVDKKRPVQNYAHAILGLAIIGGAFAQVHNGYDSEWPKMSGRSPFGRAVDIVFYIWVALIPLLYIAGLLFLPKQFRQERSHKAVPTDEYAMREDRAGPSGHNSYDYSDRPRFHERG